MERMNSDELNALIEQICNDSDPRSWKRRRALERLLIHLQKHPDIRGSSHPDYLDALDRTWEWLSLNIDQFTPTPDLPLETSLIRWINGHLYWRIKDLYLKRVKDPASLDRAMDSSGEIKTTLLEQLSDNGLSTPSLSGLDGYIEQLKQQHRQAIALELEHYIETDPQKKLRQCHPRKFPQCHCQYLCQRRLFKDPPDRFSMIARDVGINYQTLKTHWEKKCKPLLQDIAWELGYSSE